MAEPEKKLPVDIAEIIFTNPPSDKKNYQLYCESDIGDTINSIDLFEIFLTITMEGIFLKNTVDSNSIKLFNDTTITTLQPWLESLGFQVNVTSYDRLDTEPYDKYYCKIILRCDPAWSQYFELHDDITCDYHFIFGGNSPYIRGKTCTLDNLFAIFTNGCNVYKINFKCI
jgi:hypothetical protein